MRFKEFYMLYEDVNMRPPQKVRDNASKGLEYRKKANGKGGLSNKQASELGIGSGVQRAVNLKNGDTVSRETIGKMLGFFARHQKNKGIAPEYRGEPWKDRGYVAWLLWGGDEGWAWAKSIKNKLDSKSK